MKIVNLQLAITLLMVVGQLTASSDNSGKSDSKRSVKVTSALEFVHSSMGIIRELHDAWHVMLREPDTSFQDAFMRSKEHEIIGRITEINRKVNDLQTSVDDISGTTIITILRSFPEMIRLELIIHDLAEHIGRINMAGNMLKIYLTKGYHNATAVEETELELAMEATNELASVAGVVRQTTERDDNWLVERSTLEKYAEWAISPNDDSIVSLLGRIHELVVPKYSGLLKRGVYRLIMLTWKHKTEGGGSTCELDQSLQQLIYNLYNTVSMAELKGYTMIQFSLMLLKLYNKGNFTVEKELHQTNFEERTIENINTAREAMTFSDRSIFKCDPKVYIEGDNYVRVTKLLQGFIENEINLNRYGTCRETCSYYYYTEVHDCYKEGFCSVQPKCNGKVVQCQYLDSDMDICLADSSSDRRYDWIEYENGRVLGDKGYCPNMKHHKVDSWWRYLFWHCSYCFCYCDDKENSDRYFNLREVTADITNNRVVTGLRIVKVNRIIHLQIEQGELTARGVIDKNTTVWVPVEQYQVTDHDKVNGVDYHTMTWNERSLDLDDVYAPPENAMTGVRFRKIGGHVNIEIRVTPINFTTGEVYSEQKSYWIGNDNTDGSLYNPRTKLDIKVAGVPTKTNINTLDSKHDQYLVFQASDLNTDAGQNTVPFLDSQPVTSHGLLCSGAGLLHRGKQGSGGFVAPKLISYDFTHHMLPQFPVETESLL